MITNYLWAGIASVSLLLIIIGIFVKPKATSSTDSNDFDISTNSLEKVLELVEKENQHTRDLLASNTRQLDSFKVAVHNKLVLIEEGLEDVKGAVDIHSLKFTNIRASIEELRDTLTALETLTPSDRVTSGVTESADPSEHLNNQLDPELFDGRFRAILTAYNRGLSSPEIGKELGIGTGEVEFVLNLVNQQVSEHAK